LANWVRNYGFNILGVFKMINKIIQGHALNVLKTLPDKSVNCCVCSPPYWSLRDYGIDPVIWDGDKNCKHVWETEITKRPNASGGKTDWAKEKLAIKGKENYQEFVDYHKRETESDFCLKCGAWRGSLGLEPTFELYIKHLCQIFDEVKRVLRKDGTCWVNLGDSYNGNKTGNTNGIYKDRIDKSKSWANSDSFKKIEQDIPTKSLCLIPQRFAIEMVNRGWILRNTIIWHKPNCMPSSAKDRFTVDFEYVYFFVKSKKYWFEQQFESILTDSIKRELRGNRPNKYSKDKHLPKGVHPNTMSQVREYRGYDNLEEEVSNRLGRNKRAVWTIPTQPFPEAHFAVYPEELIEIPIKAGCPEFICKKCGKARVTIYKYKGGTIGKSWHNHSKDLEEGMHQSLGGLDKQGDKPYQRVDVGYSDCGCNADWESGIVLDPFMGAGTTALVALKQRKRFIGIEIKQEYIDMAKRRIKRVQPNLF